MHIAHQPAVGHIAHDVFHRTKSRGAIGLVVHHKENPRENLDHQHQKGQRAEEVPKVEILWCVVLGQVLFNERC